MGNPWTGHPFNAANNINGLDGDPITTGFGRSIHTLDIAEITKVQECYVEKVIETINDLDNVLYEIGNEHYEESFEWEEHMVRFIKAHESKKRLRHPVGMTSGGGGADSVTNDQLRSSSADWISPRERDEQNSAYKSDPPVPDGTKIILTDTDHLWGIGGSVGWVWKSFLRGLNPLYMDPYVGLHGMRDPMWERWGELHYRDHPLHEPIRRNMGYTRLYAEKMELNRAKPTPEVSSSRYCLCDEGHEYLVYFDEKSLVEVKLRPGRYAVEWLDVNRGAMAAADKVTSDGSPVKLKPPWDGDSVVYLSLT